MFLRRRAALLATPALALSACAAEPPRGSGGPCCGAITRKGEALAAFLDGTDVTHLWPNHWHVDWQTGVPDRPRPGGREAATHCSAYVAAVAQRLGIYVLRPPEHPQELLANAQMRWLREQGATRGWRQIATAREAAELANRGQLVLMAFEAPDPNRPGHIAVLRPTLKSAEAFDREGPQIAQAGVVNYSSTSAAHGFRFHAGAWLPGGRGQARFFAHEVEDRSLGL